ncbi:MAG: glucose-6-phosphate dehydrogenase [Candidatus Doudnabacteria bacterium]|nr:glucose-6-phosphate dehydrogenase [Candidatus Doudnabacteria bacterium]
MTAEAKPKTKTTLVIFGATGDLMGRRIVPALYLMFTRGQLSEDFSIIGFGRRDYSDSDFRNFLREIFYKQASSSNSLPILSARVASFLNLFSYQKGLFDNLEDYKALSDKLSKQPANKLFYLAVPPEYDETIFHNLSKSGLASQTAEFWTRILVEKPFGKNLEGAERLDLMLNSLFSEDQVYRIDHYLAKEILQNIIAFRFSNNLLEDVWSNKYIEQIDIKLIESIGIEDRGKFYDGVGALLDVGQNHLLQMLALSTMDRPEDFSAANIRLKRNAILEQVKILNDEEIKTYAIRGQYDGYLTETGVDPSSTTETYFKLKTYINSPRWEGVPITLESGKDFSKVQKEVVVTFKHPQPCLCPPGEHYKNRIHFRIQPHPGIAIEFWSKKPGFKMELEEQLLSFQYHSGTEVRYLEEYARLFFDCLQGDQTLFVSGSETMTGWRFIDPVVRAWRNNLVKLKIYKDDKILKEKFAESEAQASTNKAVGILGLGRMGAGIAKRMLGKGWEVYGWNRTHEVAQKLSQYGLAAFSSIKELVKQLSTPRIIWLMLPAGEVVDEIIFGREGLVKLLEVGDIIVDGGNSFYKDTVRRHAELTKRGIKFIDVGVSGGPAGALNGPCLMVGGEAEVYEQILPLLKDLALEGGLQFFEGTGAGHFVKMVHNGIEYGMMQSIAEGFDLLKHGPFKLDLVKVADLYNHGSVVESRLIGWLKQAYEQSGAELAGISGSVGHTGEGEWTVNTAEELKIKSTVLKAAFDFRVRSQDNPSYAGQVLSALREQFGQHRVRDSG